MHHSERNRRRGHLLGHSLLEHRPNRCAAYHWRSELRGRLQCGWHFHDGGHLDRRHLHLHGGHGPGVNVDANTGTHTATAQSMDLAGGAKIAGGVFTDSLFSGAHRIESLTHTDTALTVVHGYDAATSAIRTAWPTLWRDRARTTRPPAHGHQHVQGQHVRPQLHSHGGHADQRGSYLHDPAAAYISSGYDCFGTNAEADVDTLRASIESTDQASCFGLWTTRPQSGLTASQTENTAKRELGLFLSCKQKVGIGGVRFPETALDIRTTETTAENFVNFRKNDYTAIGAITNQANASIGLEKCSKIENSGGDIAISSTTATVSGVAYISENIIGPVRTAGRGQVFIRSTAATEVSEIFFESGTGARTNDNNVRWGLSDRVREPRTQIMISSRFTGAPDLLHSFFRVTLIHADELHHVPRSSCCFDVRRRCDCDRWKAICSTMSMAQHSPTGRSKSVAENKQVRPAATNSGTTSVTGGDRRYDLDQQRRDQLNLRHHPDAASERIHLARRHKQHR